MPGFQRWEHSHTEHGNAEYGSRKKTRERRPRIATNRSKLVNLINVGELFYGLYRLLPFCRHFAWGGGIYVSGKNKQRRNHESTFNAYNVHAISRHLWARWALCGELSEHTKVSK